MILTTSYYRELLNSIEKINPSVAFKNTSYLTFDLIWRNYEKQNLHINVPNNSTIINFIVNRLHKKTANIIFRQYADFPPLKIGDLVKRNDTKGNDLFKIKLIKDNEVTLRLKKSSSKCSMHERFLKYDSLLKYYMPVIQNAKDKTLKKYQDYFDTINLHGFLPTFFSKKIAFIAPKSIWNNLEKKAYIPSIYLPNSREDNHTAIKSIPALEDCIAYFIPKYEVCFEQLILKGALIDTLVICDTDLEAIPQIIQDQVAYHFKLIILTNDSESHKFNGVYSWNWKKEEIELFEKL